MELRLETAAHPNWLLHFCDGPHLTIPLTPRFGCRIVDRLLAIEREARQAVAGGRGKMSGARMLRPSVARWQQARRGAVEDLQSLAFKRRAATRAASSRKQIVTPAPKGFV